MRCITAFRSSPAAASSCWIEIAARSTAASVAAPGFAPSIGDAELEDMTSC
jgi:hypothetical protein